MTDQLATAHAGSAGAQARALYQGIRSGDWLDRRRVVGYGAVLLAVEIVVFLIIVAATHGWLTPLDKATTTDFASFYAAGALANAGTPALTYDAATHFAIEQQVTGGTNYQFFFYPPMFILICSLLARLPYMAAFVIFETVTLGLYLAAGRRILGESGRGAAIALLAFPAVFWTVGLGQNALLTAAIYGAATLLLERRPLLAGLLFGALCYKPHVGLLIPLALAAGGYWRSFAAAAVSATALALLSLAAFGADTWHAFLAVAAGASGVYESGRIMLAGIISPFGAVLLAGGNPALAYGVQAGAITAAALLVVIVWHRRLSLPLRAATLTAATLVAMPVVLIYDMMLAMVAVLWLVRAARETGFLPWEKTVFVLLFLAGLLSFNLSDACHFPVALAAILGLLATIIARARHEAALSRQPA